tara:strand:- start:2335 stop:3069 length:735 start_codon:yes stop_codon:yes gene_type:complete
MKIKLLLLAGNTLRARAYSQMLQRISSNEFEIKGLLYGFKTKDCFIPKINFNTQYFVSKQDLSIPIYEESIEITFNKNKWPYKYVDNVDVNSDEILKFIKNSDCDIVIFSGYGGQLLKQRHFISEKRYLHMHPGKLPIERGSTTIYYSILNERKLTVTAFFMSERIDAGLDIIYSEYQVPSKGVDIDLYYDNIIRADCLVKALKAIKKKEFSSKQNLVSEEYYVIHPVLKHLALLSLKNNNKID